MMKRLIFSCLLVTFLGQVAGAQQRYELSADMLGPLRHRYAMSFEYIPKGNVGLEINLISDKHSEELWSFPRIPSTGGVIIDYYPISLGAHDEYVTGVSVAAKFYMSRKNNGSGLFGGGILENFSYTGASETAKQSYRANYLTELPRNLRTAAGLLVGYKALIYKHFTLDIKAKETFPLFSDGWTYYGESNVYVYYADFMFDLSISLGYRF